MLLLSSLIIVFIVIIIGMIVYANSRKMDDYSRSSCSPPACPPPACNKCNMPVRRCNCPKRVNPSCGFC